MPVLQQLDESSWSKMIQTKSSNPEGIPKPRLLLGPKQIFQHNSKCQYTQKEILAVSFAFFEIGHLTWGSGFPVIVFEDNHSVTRSFETKILPPPCGTPVTMYYSITS